jgi:hypothetical protein
MDIAIENHGPDYDQLHASAELAPERPRTRADTVGGPRPCPWVSCKYHLLLDVKPGRGLILNVRQPGPTTCALDVADEGGATYERIGQLLGLRKQSVRLIQPGAKAKCKSTP